MCRKMSPFFPVVEERHVRISRRDRIFSRGIVFVLTIWLASAAHASNIRLVSGSRQLPAQYSPVLTAAGFMVPISIAELFGGGVEVADGRFIVRRGTESVEFMPGVPWARMGEAERELVAAPIAVDGELYVPLRFLGDFLRLRISWDVAGNTLDLAPWTSSLGRSRTGVSQMFEPALTLPSAGFEVGTESSASPISASIILPAPASGSFFEATGAQGDQRSQGEQGSNLQESIARLLGRLDSLFQQGERGWRELERATGISLTPVRVGSAWEYHFRGISASGIATALLVDPPRLVVDLTGVPGTSLDPLTTPDPLVLRVRAMDFQGQMRLVFDLAESVGHRVQEDGSGAKLILYRPLTNVGVEVSPTGGRISLDVPGDTSYKISRLAAPDRLVLDLYDTTLVAAPALHGPFEGPITQVRIAQFQPHIARIVLDVASATHVDVAAGERGLALVWGDQVGSVAYRIASEREFHVGVNAPSGSKVRIFRLTHPDRLVMDVLGMRLQGPIEEELFLEGPVSRLRVSQYDETTTRVVADLRRHVQYRLTDEAGRVVLVMQEPLLAGRILTVDAGHGGVDGGAVGVRRGILEKDVNLDIALRLQALLKEAQAEVHMTRVDDTFVDLWSRADLANQTNSDVLVSIHANSAPENAMAMGTETYVRVGEPDSERLGAAIQQSLTSALSTVDRGVRPNRYLIVRRAEMPAALVEVGFLAHPEEEELLAEGWFRQRAAEGIYNGLLRYFYPEDELDSEALAASQEKPWNALKGSVAAAGSPAGS